MMQIFICTGNLELAWGEQESDAQLAAIERELDEEREDELRLAHDPDADEWPSYAAPIFDDIGDDGEMVPIECAFLLGEALAP